MAQTTSLVFNGGSIPSPAPAPTGSGKAKLLRIGEIFITEQGEQVTKKVICDPDSVTTVAPFMEVVTATKLAELVNANSILVLDDGSMQYLMSDATTTVEDETPVCTSVNFLGLSKENRAKVVYNCTRVTDELTLQQVVKVGEPIETNFNLVIADSEDTNPGTLIDKMEVVDDYYDPEDPDSPPKLLDLHVTEDEQGNCKVVIDESELTDAFYAVADDIGFIEDRLGELPSDEHGYFNSTLYTTPGDGTTTNLAIDDFRIANNRDVHGESIDFVPTHQEGGIDYGEIYLEPGTYVLAVQVTLQWVGDPRGTFLPQVSNVCDQPFDFSYEHEDVVRLTRIVTRDTRGKFLLNISLDADTPKMGIWIKSLEIAQVASYNHPAVTHDATLTGSGQLGEPLGVTPAAFGKVKDIPTSISQFRNGDVIPVDGPNGPAKMPTNELLSEASQNAFEYTKQQAYFATRQALTDETSRATQRENEIEALFVAPTEEAVAAWLYAHPEATTTVQDHSLTHEKLVIGTLNFVTPEMFGAVGDGVTDDVAAFEAMLANGGKLCLLGQSKTYYVSRTLNYFSNTIIDFNNSTLISGVDSHVFSSIAPSDNRRSNVIFRNGYIRGHGSDGHVGDQGAGILGWRVDNVIVENMEFSYTYGDGMLFRTCENVIIRNCEITKYGRNGISPISGSFYIEGLKIYGGPLSGANPGLCFDCEPESGETTKLHIVNCELTDAFFVDFYTPNDDDDFCIELLMENTKVLSNFNGVRFVSNKNLNAKNVKLFNCDFKMIISESSCIFMEKTNGIVVDSCKFSHSIQSPVNTHCISAPAGLKNLVLKNVDFTGFPNALFSYTGGLESITLDGVTTSIYAYWLKNSKLLNSRILGLAIDGAHTLSESTGNISFNSILPANLRQVCKLGGTSGQFFGSTLLSNEYAYEESIFTDPGNTKIIEIPLPAEDVSRGHCYLVSIGYSHRGSMGHSGQRVFAIVCGDLGATITDIVNVGSKSISISYDHAKHSLVVTFEYCFGGTMSWSVFG